MTSMTVTESAGRRIIFALFVSQSLFSAATIASFTLAPIVAALLTGSDSAAGAPTTFTLIGRAAVAYPIGWLMDRIGRRNGLSLGYLLGTLGAAVSVISIMYASFPGFLFGSLLVGAARGSAEQSRFVAAEVQPLNRQAKAMGFIVFAGTVGAVGGPQLIGPSERWMALLNMEPITGAFVAATLLLFLATAVTFFFLRPDPLIIAQSMNQHEEVLSGSKQSTVVAGTPTAVVGPSLRQVFSRPMVILAVAAMLISQLAMTLLMVITPLHMHHHHHGREQIALVIMAHTLGMFGLSSVTGWLIDRLGRILIIVIGALILVLSGLLMPFSLSVPTLAFALFLLGLGWNFCFIAGSSLLTDGLAAGERGRIQGVSEMMVALASGAGSLGTGYLFTYGGIVAVSVTGLVFALVLGLMAGWIGFSYQLAKSPEF